MGTTWSVRYAGEAKPARLRPGIKAVLETVVSQMSGWLPSSNLCRFNTAIAGSRRRPPAEFAAVLACALEIAEASDGAFDPTMAPLVDLWGFGPSPAPKPMPEAYDVAQAMARVGWRKLPFKQGDLLQPGGMGLDFSGIAKGYAVDLVAEHLAALGLASFLVEIGGELRGEGIRPDGQPWWVDLEAVPGSDFAPVRIALHGLSVATSGDYRRAFTHHGRTYAHTLDPSTGRPLDNGVASVSVLHAEAMRADAWATALGVLGPQGMPLAEREGLAVHMVVRDGAGFCEFLSPAFSEMLG